MSPKKKQTPKKPKINLNALLAKPKPINLHGPKYYLEHAREYPIVGCWVYAGWQESGIAPVVVARQQDETRVIFGVFLLDWYCLGVKNAFCNADFPLKKFQASLSDFCSGNPQPCEIDFAHEFIYGALAYAARYGFEPHPDYKLASLVLDAPDVHPPRHNLEFGKDGKPSYINGPYDSEARINQIIQKLERTAGKGNYDVLLILGDPSGDDG